MRRGPERGLVEKKDLDSWFVEEVLPIEPVLMYYLRRNWRVDADIADLRQDIYIRIYEAAAKERPLATRAFVLQTARNLLIDRARHASIVPIEACADIDLLDTLADDLTPERHVAARMELGRLQTALEHLPPRCREVVKLRRIHGLSQRETADAMGITIETVENQLAKGIRVMAAALLGNGPALAPGKSGARRKWTRTA